jgi:SnoaL-like polyketide cyclase
MRSSWWRVTVDELFDAWERAWSGRDPAGFEPLCDPADVHYEDPLTAEPLESVDAIVRHAQRLWAGFPDARVQQTGPRLFDGERAAAPMKLLATHTAELQGLTPTNRFVIVHGIAYAQLREGRIHRIRVFFDLYHAAVQLGVLPKAGTLGEKALLMLRGFGLRQR